MPARIIEELASRKKEKIATFLTFESIVAVVIAFLPIFMISAQWPLLTRVPLCLGAAIAGYICTVELHGLPLYEHVLWTARGLFRLKTQGNRVVPEDLPGAVPAPNQDRVLVVSGAIELVQRDVISTRHVLPAPANSSQPSVEGDALEEQAPEHRNLVLDEHAGIIEAAGRSDVARVVN